MGHSLNLMIRVIFSLMVHLQYVLLASSFTAYLWHHPFILISFYGILTLPVIWNFKFHMLTVLVFIGLLLQGVQSENRSLVYYLPGYNPYATGALMGVDGQCLGQQPYYSSGYFQPPVSYASEAMPCYSWDSTYVGDVSNGILDGFGNVKYGSGSAFAKSNGFNSTKSNGLGTKLSKSTYAQPNRPLSKVL